MYDRPTGTYLGDLSLYRCDQCTRCKNVCDRVLPSCAYCSKRNIPCTLNRTLQRKSYSTKPRQSYLVKNKAFVEINHEEIRFKFKLEKNQVTHTALPVQLLKEVEHGPTAIIRTTFNSIKKRSRLSNLIVLLNCPQLDKPNPGLTVCMLAIKKFNLFSTGYTFAPSIHLNIEQHSAQARKLFTNLFNLYFQHINTFLPLFDKDTFFKRQRSKFLVSSILLRGYFFLKSEDRNPNILNYLEMELYEQFKLHKFKVSLDSLQALLIMYSGIETDWVNFAEITILSIAVKMCTCLGLDRRFVWSRKGCDGIYKRERILAYAAIQQNISKDGWLDSSVVQSLVSAPIEDIHLLQENLDPYKISLNLIAEFFILTASIQYKVVTTRDQIAHDQTEYKVVNAFIANTVESLQLQVLSLLSQLQLLKNNYPKYRAEVEYTIQVISFHYHLLVFRAYSLPVHSTKNNIPPTEYKKGFDRNLELGLETSAQVVNFGAQIILNAPPLSVIPYVTQAFLFMLRYKHYHSSLDTIEALITKSYTRYDYLIANTSNPLLAKLNLSVVNALKDYSSSATFN